MCEIAGGKHQSAAGKHADFVVYRARDYGAWAGAAGTISRSAGRHILLHSHRPAGAAQRLAGSATRPCRTPTLVAGAFGNGGVVAVGSGPRRLGADAAPDLSGDTGPGGVVAVADRRRAALHLEARDGDACRDLRGHGHRRSRLGGDPAARCACASPTGHGESRGRRRMDPLR